MIIRAFIVCILALFGVSAYFMYSGKTMSLNDIETAAGLSSLSKLGNYTTANSAIDEQWINVKKTEMRRICASNTPVSVKELPRNVLTNVSFKGKQKAPHEGSWVQSYVLSNCGQDRQINILYTADGGNTPDSRLMLDGTSLTNVVEQSDGIVYALRASRVNRLDCTNWKVDNTEFLGAEMGSTTGAWQEKWVADGCGSKYEVMMSFYPENGATTQVKAEVLGKKL